LARRTRGAPTSSPVAGGAVVKFRLPGRTVRGRWTFAYLTLAPVVAIYLYLRIIPISQTFLMSFYEWNLIARRRPFIGLENYAGLMRDQAFLTALTNTTVIAFGILALSVPSALFVANLLARPRRLSAVYETAFFLPVVTSMVPATLAWKWILDAKLGPLNQFVGWFGVPPQAWLIKPELAIFSVILLSAWKLLGYNMIIFLVGMRNIPATYYEAAEIDGASPVQRFRFITLPLIRPILLFVSVITVIQSYNVYTQVYVLASDAQGAPGYVVRVLVYDMIENGFRFFRMGYASAEAMVLLAIVLVLTAIQFGALRDSR
jgi:multiple sugar transport system permease protein